MSLTDAMTDLVAEVRAGAEPEVASAEIANDYGLNVALLRRKFAEAYPMGLPTVLDRDALATLQRKLWEAQHRQDMADMAAIAEYAAQRQRQRRANGRPEDDFDRLLRLFIRSLEA